MALYALMCLDKPNALEVRLGAREAHLAYVRERIDQVKLAGPLLDDQEQMAGSLLILDLADRPAAEAFNAADPYTLAGLWASVEIRAFKASIGQV